MRRALRCTGFIAIGTVIFICGLSSRSAATEKIFCNDITTIDFMNLSIAIPNRGMVQLDNGTAFSSEAGVGREARDWKMSLVQDEILRPSPSTRLRLIKVNADHLTGSGVWDHVFVYQCRDGELVRIFQERYLYGVKIQRVTDGDLLFTSWEWMKGDPTSAPSKEKLSSYRWDEKTGTFILVRSVLRRASKGSN